VHFSTSNHVTKFTMPLHLRIKEAAEVFEAQVKDTKVVSFTQGEISDRDEYLLAYANQLGVVIGGRQGTGIVASAI